MKRHIYKIILTLAAVALAVGLTACDPKPIKGGQPNAVVYGNGSLVVQQGDFIYFVNGMTTKEADNKAGEVEKGAIMRAKLDANGDIVGGYETIVKQAYFTSYTGGGLYIFGEWIYYVTPNPSKDKTGTTLNSQTLVMRTKIDGTKTKKIATIKAEGVQYKVTKDYFIYLDGTELKSIDLNKNNFKTTTVATDVTGAKFPTASVYNPGGNPDIYDYVVYTKNVEDEVTGQTHNEVMAVDGAGRQKTLIAEKLYFNGDDRLVNLENMMTYNLGGASYSGEDLVVNASRTSFEVSGQQENGVFSYTFKGAKDYVLDRSDVRWLASAAKSSYMPIFTDDGRGILVSENNGVFYYKGADENAVRTDGKSLENMKKTTEIANGVKVYGGLANIVSAVSLGGGVYRMFFTPDTSNGALQSVDISIVGNPDESLPPQVGTYDKDYKNFKPYDKVRILVASDFVSNWISSSFETYGDNLYCYFVYAKDYDYLYRINLSEALRDGRDYIADNAELIKIVGKFSGADQKTYDEREAAK
jgi:hypothetical protein